MEINLSTAETYIVNYLQNSGRDDGDWDTYGAAKDLRDICDMNGYTDYEQVDSDEFTELLKEHALYTKPQPRPQGRDTTNQRNNNGRYNNPCPIRHIP